MFLVNFKWSDVPVFIYLSFRVGYRSKLPKLCCVFFVVFYHFFTNGRVVNVLKMFNAPIFKSKFYRKSVSPYYDLSTIKFAKVRRRLHLKLLLIANLLL